MRLRNFFLFSAMLISIILAGCTTNIVQKITQDKPQLLTDSDNDYKIVSTVPYDNKLCGGISYSRKPEGFNIGMKVTLKDKDDETILYGFVNGGTHNENYPKAFDCIEMTDSEEAIITAYSEGYTPIVLKITIPRGKLANVEVYMQKSCTGGPSCFENIENEINFALDIEDQKSKFANEAMIEQYKKETKEEIFYIINSTFVLQKSDYNLQCLECYEDGSLLVIKAKGKYKDGSPFGLNYKSGPCTFGGSACPRDTCFNSPASHLFDPIKEKFCNEVTSVQRKIENYGCNGESYDRTQEVRKKCFEGEFEKNQEGNKILLIKHNIGVCGSSVEMSDLSC